MGLWEPFQWLVYEGRNKLSPLLTVCGQPLFRVLVILYTVHISYNSSLLSLSFVNLSSSFLQASMTLLFFVLVWSPSKAFLRYNYSYTHTFMPPLSWISGFQTVVYQEWLKKKNKKQSKHHLCSMHCFLFKEQFSVVLMVERWSTAKNRFRTIELDPILIVIIKWLLLKGNTNIHGPIQ